MAKNKLNRPPNQVILKGCAHPRYTTFDNISEAFEDWTSISAWMFLQRFPTPESLAQAGKRQWQEFLHSRRPWGSDQGPRPMEIFARATEFAGSAPTIKAKSLLALSLVQMLFAVEKQLTLYRQRIEELFASSSRSPSLRFLAWRRIQDCSTLAGRDWRRP